MFSKWGGFKVEKAKPALAQSLIRLSMLKNKKATSIKKSKKAVAVLLNEEKVEKARLEAERIVRDDFAIEALEILELMCELVRDNIKLVESQPTCPYDMVEAVSTLLFAADRIEVPELLIVKEQFIKKYGNLFYEAAKSNQGGVVNERVLHRLSGLRPNAFLVLNYMKEVAKEYSVQWEPDELTAELGTRFDAPMAAPDGSSVVPGSGSGLGSAAYQVTDGRVTKPGDGSQVSKTAELPKAPTYPKPSVQVNKVNKMTSETPENADDQIGYAKQTSTSNNEDSLSIDSLQARFNAFKNEQIAKVESIDNAEGQDAAPSTNEADELDIPVAPMHPAVPSNDNDLGLPSVSALPSAALKGPSNQPKDAAVPKFDELLNRFAKLRGE